MWIYQEFQGIRGFPHRKFHSLSKSYPQTVNNLWITVNNTSTKDVLSTSVFMGDMWITIKRTEVAERGTSGWHFVTRMD